MLPASRPIESFTTRLRGLAQRGSSGALRLDFRGYSLAVVLERGSIVDVVDSRESLTEEIVRRLIEAGRITRGEPITTSNLDELFGELSEISGESRDPIDPVFFKRVVRECLLERLFSLELQTAVGLRFSVAEPQPRSSYSPHIDVDNLFAECAARELQSGAFLRAFPAGSSVRPLNGGTRGLSSLEYGVLRCCTSSLPVEVIYHRALLSRPHFEEALLGLFERGCLEVDPPACAQAVNAPQSAACSGNEIARALTAIVEASDEAVYRTNEFVAASIVERAEQDIAAPPLTSLLTHAIRAIPLLTVVQLLLFASTVGAAFVWFEAAARL